MAPLTFAGVSCWRPCLRSSRLCCNCVAICAASGETGTFVSLGSSGLPDLIRSHVPTNSGLELLIVL